MRTIIGLTPPASGSIRFNGGETARKKPHEVAMAGIGFVPEERCIFPNLTVHQNLLMGIKPGHYGKPAQGKWDMDRCYRNFPMLKVRHRQRGGTLSGGEMQILTIARSLMGNPELIMIDEPTEGLSPLMVAEVSKVIREIHESGTTVLLVEQKLPLVLESCPARLRDEQRRHPVGGHPGRVEAAGGRMQALSGSVSRGI